MQRCPFSHLQRIKFTLVYHEKRLQSDDGFSEGQLMNESYSLGSHSVKVTAQDIFPDLSELYVNCQNNVANIEKGDYLLDASFRENYLRYNLNNSVYYSLDIHKYSAEFRRSERSVLVASRSFREAAEAAPYYKALEAYRDFLFCCLKNHGYESKKDCEELLDRAKLYKPDGSSQAFSSDDYDQLFAILEHELRTRFPRFTPAELTATSKMLLTFATDYSWWGGAKQLSREDHFVSPLLTILGKAASSGEIYAFIVRDLASDDSLLDSAVNLKHVCDQCGDVDIRGLTDSDRLHTGSNVMIYGAPGTGKSWFIENELYRGSHVIRTVFHPEYSYFDFVGSYKPVPVYSATTERMLDFNWGDAGIPGHPTIDYRFVPGPFVDAVIDAYDNPMSEYCLIIDEVNRASASAVFGDMFQLLDRNKDRASEYSIKPQPELAKYLKSTGHKELAENFFIPSNLSLAATMNNADLGVSYLDTAFKRRWSFTYIAINLEKNASLNEPVKYAGLTVSLFDVFRAINSKLCELRINEDRWVGPFFVAPQEIAVRGAREALKKVAMYLWDDVFRNDRSRFFEPNIMSLSEVERSLESGDPLLLCDIINGLKQDTEQSDEGREGDVVDMSANEA